MKVTPESELLGKKFKIAREEATLLLSQEKFAERLGEIFYEIHGENAHKKGHRGDVASFISESSIKRYERGEIPHNKINMLVELYVQYSGLSKYDYVGPKVSAEEFRRKYSGVYEEVLTVDSDEFDTRKELEKAIDDYYQKIQKDVKFKLLERFYIPLEIMESPELSGSIVGESFDLNGDWSDHEDLLEKGEDGETISKQQQGHVNDILELLKKEVRFVLLGDPGSGKTISLQWLCFNSIKNYHSGDKVFIYFPLAKYQSEKGLVASICYESGFSEKNLNSLFKSRRVMLLLDSLNECKPEAQETCASQIQLFINDWPDIPLILTVRTQSWSQNIELPAFIIQPLSREHQVDFLKAYLKDKDHAEIVLNQLYEQPGCELITNNPWMLFLFTEIIKNDEELPENRSQIYRRYIMEWFKREISKAKRAKIELSYNENQLFRKLSLLANYMRHNGYVIEAPISWINEKLGDVWSPDGELLDILGRGIICTVNFKDDNFSFFHEDLHEYLAVKYAASYAVSSRKELKKIALSKYDIWYNALDYAHEIKKDVSFEIWYFGYKISSSIKNKFWDFVDYFS